VISYVILELRSNIGGLELFPLLGLTYIWQKPLKCQLTEKNLLHLFTVKGSRLTKLKQFMLGTAGAVYLCRRFEVFL